MIVLAMIVKDEAETIRPTLASAREVFGEHLRSIVVHDTGSTDGTLQVLADEGCTVSEHPFDRFDNARNRALMSAEMRAEKGDHIAMISAGCILRGTYRRTTKKKAASAEWRMGVTRWTKTLMYPRDAHPAWRWTGAVHETINPVGQYVQPHTLPDSGVIVDFCLTDRVRPKRWERDLELLKNEKDPRSQFYLAQTYQCLGQTADARRVYTLRAERTDGWVQERVVSYIRMCNMAETSAEAEQYARMALALDPDRPEVWVSLCQRAHMVKNWPLMQMRAELAMQCEEPPGQLFRDASAGWRARDYMALALYRQGMPAEASYWWTQALKHQPPQDEAARLCNSIARCQTKT